MKFKKNWRTKCWKRNIEIFIVIIKWVNDFWLNWFLQGWSRLTIHVVHIVEVRYEMSSITNFHFLNKMKIHSFKGPEVILIRLTAGLISRRGWNSTWITNTAPYHLSLPTILLLAQNIILASTGVLCCYGGI